MVGTGLDAGVDGHRTVSVPLHRLSILSSSSSGCYLVEQDYHPLHARTRRGPPDTRRCWARLSDVDRRSDPVWDLRRAIWPPYGARLSGQAS